MKRYLQTLSNAFPVLICSICLICEVLPNSFFSENMMGPLFVLPTVFYWTLYRPDILRPGALIILGFLADVFYNTYFGIHAVGYLLTYFLVLQQRQFFLKRSFTVIWLGLAIVLFITTALQFLIQYFLASQSGFFFSGLEKLIVQIFFTVILYPALCRGYIWINQKQLG